MNIDQSRKLKHGTKNEQLMLNYFILFFCLDKL